jgi:SHAQKYF class myb-like DNA-binding protein
MNGGRWTEQEHQSFLAGLRLYGREWKKVASKIKTRTSAQIRSHAQKYFAKLARDEEARRNGQDPGRSSSLGGGDSYFSDGGSSSALNSGDETDSISSVTVVRAANLPSSKSSSSYSFGASYTDTAKPGSMNNYYRSSLHAGYTKKRSRSPDSSPTSTSGVPSLNQHKRSSRDALEVEHLPSQEELLEKVSPNVRQRLSSLIEAEMCALQVLSCYASLQQKDHCTHASASSSSMYHPTKKPMSLAMITEQIPSTSSIY